MPTINKRRTELYDTHDTHISAYNEVLNAFHLKTIAECTIRFITWYHFSDTDLFF